MGTLARLEREILMPTKVFISWSGDLSRKLGETLRDWLPSALQYVKPYFTPEDIEKGAKWSAEISKELESSNIGVICLTRDNTEKPWILFEAGALSKSIDKGRVCTLLFDLEPADVKGPLTSFQSTRFGKEDFKRLVTTINNAAGDARLDSSVLDGVFEMWWPQLELNVAHIIGTHDKVAKKEKRSDRDILEELLELTRLSTKHPIRTRGVSRHAVFEIVEALYALTALSTPEHRELGRAILRQIDRPLRRLTMEAGMPEMYENLSMLRHRSEPESDAIIQNIDVHAKSTKSSGLP